MAKKILKNTTNIPIPMSVLGLADIPAFSQIEIQIYDYVLLSSDDTIAYLDPLLASGDLVANDGTEDLDEEGSRNYILFPNTSDSIIFEPGNSANLLKTSQTLNPRITVAQGIRAAANFTKVSLTDNSFGTLETKIEGGTGITVSTSSDGSGNETLLVSASVVGGGTSVIGTIHQLAYSGVGSAKNKWLVLYGDNKKKSNEAPGLMMWKSKLVGISFTNEKKSVETDVLIHVASENDGASPTTEVLNWQVRNSRVCRKTNFSPDIIFEPGDKIGIYLKDQGTDPKDPTVILYFQAIENNSEEVCKTYDKDFNISGAGTGSS